MPEQHLRPRGSSGQMAPHRQNNKLQPRATIRTSASNDNEKGIDADTRRAAGQVITGV